MRHAGGEKLSGQARRLWQALVAEGSYALPDSLQEDYVIVRASRQGISVGGGRFPLKAVNELLSRDLIAPGRLGEKQVFRISESGRAFFRRESAPPDVAFLVQHQELIPGYAEIDGRKARVTMDAAESPLDWLRRRKDRSGNPYVDDASYQAGERLRKDLTLAAMLPRVTANWDAAVSDRSRGGVREAAGASDTAVAARQRARGALDAVGTDFADLLIDLCGFLKGLATIERERGWPARSGKLMVKLALARLADHYGLQRTAHGPQHSRGVRTWRAAVPGE